MLPFFGDLVVRTDEARRDFETHPVVLDAVANGMTVERYRKLLLELYHVVWHFNPVCAAAASRMPRPVPRRCATSSTSTCTRSRATSSGCTNDLEAVGVGPAEARPISRRSTRWR